MPKNKWNRLGIYVQLYCLLKTCIIKLLLFLWPAVISGEIKLIQIISSELIWNLIVCLCWIFKTIKILILYYHCFYEFIPEFTCLLWIYFVTIRITKYIYTIIRFISNYSITYNRSLELCLISDLGSALKFLIFN